MRVSRVRVWVFFALNCLTGAASGVPVSPVAPPPESPRLDSASLIRRIQSDPAQLQLMLRQSLAGLNESIMKSGTGLGYRLNDGLAWMWSANGNSTDGVKDRILVKTGLAMSAGLRAYYLIGDGTFEFTWFCNQKWILDNLHRGIYQDPPEPFFPASIHDLEFSRLASDGPFFDPTAPPYAQLREKMSDADDKSADLSFEPGKVLYVRLGPKDVRGVHRSSGFILLIYGARKDSKLSGLVPAGRTNFVRTILGQIPSGVVYADGVSPEADAHLTSNRPVTPLAVLRALDLPAEKSWEGDLVIGTFDWDESEGYRLGAAYSPQTDLGAVVRRVGEPTARSMTDPWIGNLGVGLYVGGREIEFTLFAMKPQEIGRGGKWFVDWGDGEGQPLSIESPTRHTYKFNAVYYLNVLDLNKQPKLAFRILLFPRWAAAFKPNLPPVGGAFFATFPSAHASDPVIQPLLDSLRQLDTDAKKRYQEYEDLLNAPP